VAEVNFLHLVDVGLTPVRSATCHSLPTRDYRGAKMRRIENSLSRLRGFVVHLSLSSRMLVYLKTRFKCLIRNPYPLTIHCHLPISFQGTSVETASLNNELLNEPSTHCVHIHCPTANIWDTTSTDEVMLCKATHISKRQKLYLTDLV